MATKTAKTVNAVIESNEKVSPKTKKIKIVSEKFCDFFEEMAEQRFFL